MCLSASSTVNLSRSLYAPPDPGVFAPYGRPDPAGQRPSQAARSEDGVTGPVRSNTYSGHDEVAIIAAAR